MNDRASESVPPDEPILSVKDWSLEATSHYAHPVEDEFDTLRLDHMKHIRDLAFAVAFRESGHLAESEFVRATRHWTAFGATKLADHVASISLISDAELGTLQSKADTLLERAMKKAKRSVTSSDSDPQQRLISSLNPDGRLASMLGLIGGSSLTAGEIEDRSVGARYTLLRKLGQGGLGTVWLARDENLNRYVAVKELNGDARTGANGRERVGVFSPRG